MTEDQSRKDSDTDNQKSWLSKLANIFTDEPQSKDDLIQILQAAYQNDLLDVDALNMMKGAKTDFALKTNGFLTPNRVSRKP